MRMLHPGIADEAPNLLPALQWAITQLALYGGKGVVMAAAKNTGVAGCRFCMAVLGMRGMQRLPYHVLFFGRKE